MWLWPTATWSAAYTNYMHYTVRDRLKKLLKVRSMDTLPLNDCTNVLHWVKQMLGKVVSPTATSSASYTISDNYMFRPAQCLEIVVSSYYYCYSQSTGNNVYRTHILQGHVCCESRQRLSCGEQMVLLPFTQPKCQQSWACPVIPSNALPYKGTEVKHSLTLNPKLHRGVVIN